MTTVCGSYVETSLSSMSFFPTLRGAKDDLKEPPEQIAILSTLDLHFWKAILESKTGHFGEQHAKGQIREVTCCQAHKVWACGLEDCCHKIRNKKDWESDIKLLQQVLWPRFTEPFDLAVVAATDMETQRDRSGNVSMHEPREHQEPQVEKLSNIKKVQWTWKREFFFHRPVLAIFPLFPPSSIWLMLL